MNSDSDFVQLLIAESTVVVMIAECLSSVYDEFSCLWGQNGAYAASDRVQ